MTILKRQALIACALLSLTSTFAKDYCTKNDSTCWPTLNDTDTLTKALDPTAKRILSWKSGQARTSGVPVTSPDEQPLFGLGKAGLKPVYVRDEKEANETCFLPQENPFMSEFCMASTRNVPYEGWMPAFIVFPLNSTQVQIAYKFAIDHNLCVSVLSTGHDYLNRHSCQDGVQIRTSLLKDIEWDLKDTKNFGYPDGNVKFGAGVVWGEGHESAAKNNRVVASGWADTVGVVGWGIGGGRGPMTPVLGLGVDNILEIDIVIANGTLITANSKNNSDLYWAIRGGGGSTWGIITSITYKAHLIPDGGFTAAVLQWNGTYFNY